MFSHHHHHLITCIGEYKSQKRGCTYVKTLPLLFDVVYMCDFALQPLYHSKGEYVLCRECRVNSHNFEETEGRLCLSHYTLIIPSTRKKLHSGDKECERRRQVSKTKHKKEENWRPARRLSCTYRVKWKKKGKEGCVEKHLTHNNAVTKRTNLRNKYISLC